MMTEYFKNLDDWSDVDVTMAYVYEHLTGDESVREYIPKVTGILGALDTLVDPEYMLNIMSRPNGTVEELLEWVHNNYRGEIAVVVLRKVKDER